MEIFEIGVESKWVLDDIHHGGILILKSPSWGSYFIYHARGGHVHMGGRDNCSQGDNLGQNKYYTITFFFQEK